MTYVELWFIYGKVEVLQACAASLWIDAWTGSWWSTNNILMAPLMTPES